MRIYNTTALRFVANLHIIYDEPNHFQAFFLVVHSARNTTGHVPLALYEVHIAAFACLECDEISGEQHPVSHCSDTRYIKFFVNEIIENDANKQVRGENEFVHQYGEEASMVPRIDWLVKKNAWELSATTIIRRLCKTFANW